ncbi:unnamed protein product [Coffea canephora]|uniref:catalase n=1 Tax=Coffea canephora TaxID=49390 RepID=A0A068V0I6_COFCA|nr:unnamed protein product [Coffea canephora]
MEARNSNEDFAIGCILSVKTIHPNDKLLQTRIFAYGDTQRHRLGPNYMQLPVNAPKPKKLSADLPPLWNRVKANLSLKDAAELALKKMPSAE